jgi:hypothetical protein
MPNQNLAKPQNRRKSMRRKPRGTICLECRAGGHGLGPNLALNVLDLSDSGVCLILSKPLPAASEVEILISGHGVRKSIKRLADVRWQRKFDDGTFGAGVEFQKRLEYRDWLTFSTDRRD